MTRIVAGSARGRRLAVPPSGTRPTSDRVREAMFSALEAVWRADGRSWSSVHVVDGYAGSGALGLEALSRGAAGAVLIERARPAAALVRANAGSLGLPGATVLVSPVARAAGQPASGPEAALLLLDPPYEVAAEAIAAEIEAFARHGWLEPDAVVVVERPASDGRSPLPAGWNEMSHRRYGDTMLWYGRRRPKEDHA